MAEMTTAELTKAGLKWLKVQWHGGEDFGHPGCSVIAVDKMSMTGERPDLIGWAETRSTLIETKLTRADFFRDSSKVWRMYGPGMGQVRWYLTPKSLVKPEELPYSYGLLEWDGIELTVVVNAMNRGRYYDVDAERALLLSLLRAKP